MSTTGVAPHWTIADQWTAVVLAIVPAPDLPVPAETLSAAVSAAVRSDVIAFDLVTVGLGPTVDASPERDDEVAAALLRLAAAPGHLVGPRVMLACVVVAGHPGTVDAAADRLRRHPRLRRLSTAVHRVVVTGLDQGVAAIERLVATLMDAAERHPETAIDETRFLAELSAVSDAASPAEPPANPPTADNSPRPGNPLTPAGQPSPGNSPAAAHQPSPTGPPGTGRVAGKRPPRTGPLRVHRAESDRTSFWRRFGWRGRDNPASVLTEPYWLDHLAATAATAAVTQLILVPDYEAPTKGIVQRRRTIALALDEALGRVYRHPSGRDLNVALEVLVATSPLSRATPLRPAGVLTAGELPSVPLDYFDLYDVVDELIEAQDRARRALTRRRIEVTSTHLIVLTTTAPLYHEEAAERFADLVRGARVSWLHVGPGETLPDEFTYGHADRVTRYRDHDDVVSEVMADSEDLYGIAAPPFSDEDDGEDETPAQEQADETPAQEQAQAPEPAHEQAHEPEAAQAQEPEQKQEQPA